MGADINKAGNGGVTPLLITAQNGYETVVQALIELGANINKAEEKSPLVVATRR